MKTSSASQGAVDVFHSGAPSEFMSPDRLANQPNALEPWHRVGFRLLVVVTAVLVPCVISATILVRGLESTRLWWLSETGPVERASGWGYLLLVIGLFTVGAMRLGEWLGNRRAGKIRPTISGGSEAIWHPMLLAGCMAAFAAREFDWHNIWTTRCVLKTRFYVDPAISIQEKLAASVVLCLIGFLLVSAIRAYGRKFTDQLRRGQTAALLTATAIALLPVSKALDSGPSICKRLFAVDSSNARRFLGSVEEIIELAIPVLFLMAATITIWSWCRRDSAWGGPARGIMLRRSNQS